MRKNSIYKYLKPLLFVLLVFLVSCNKVNSDAKKAAKLTNKSIEKTHQLKLKEAEELYLKSKDIIEKYESHKKSEKFFDLYQKYRDKDYPVSSDSKEQ